MITLPNKGFPIIANRETPKVGDIFTVVQLVVVFNIPSVLVEFKGMHSYIPQRFIPNFETSVGRKFRIVGETIKHTTIDNFVVKVRQPIIKVLD